MVKFDIEYRRTLLLDPVGGYEWSLKRNMEESKARGGLSGSADSSLAKAIECLLVGFDEPAKRLLQQASEWVRVAIASGEHPQRYFPGATEAARFRTLALCNWLLFNRHDTDNLRRFVKHKDQYLNDQNRKDKVDVTLGILTYVNAEAFARALEIFSSTRGLSAPTSLSPRNEAEMAYILSQNHLGVQYSRDDVLVAATKFLKKNMQTWLSNGHWVRAAEWLKILYWNDSDRTVQAKQVLMKCFDFTGACG